MAGSRGSAFPAKADQIDRKMLSAASHTPHQGLRSKEQLRDIVDNMPGFAFRRVLARSGAVTYPYIGTHMRSLYGIGPRREDTVRKQFESYLHPDDRQAFLAAMAVSARHLSPLEIAVRLGSSTGVSGWLRIVSYPHKLDDGAIQWDCIALDISRAKALETHGTYHEAMTGLPNRALFMHWLDHALERAKKLQSSAFVIALELVSLTRLRESSGFEVGDACIREAARRLQAAVLFADTIAYTGGGGFLVVLVPTDGQDDFTAPLRAIGRQFEPRFHHNGQELPLNISMGISVIPGDGLEAETLIGNATTALNKAKHTPDQPYQFYDAQMTERAVARLDVESELRSALRDKELMLFYIPYMKRLLPSPESGEALWWLTEKESSHGIVRWTGCKPQADGGLHCR